MPRPLRVFLVAAEESGDRLGAPLMRALRSMRPEVEFTGVGGAQMTAQGITPPFPIDELSIMGFTSIPAKLPNILRRIRQTAAAVAAAKPDVLVIIDSPDFTHRVARRVRTAMPDLPIVDYVSPSVWAWRPGRAKAMRAYVDHVLALLPFEPEAHRRLGGPACTYVGHPMIERIAELRPNTDEARRREASPPVLLVMPGSRRGELKYMLPIFEQTVAQVAATVGPLEVVIAAVPRLAAGIESVVASWRVRPRLAVTQEDRDAAFRAARAALVKSGTGTLELALAGVPMVASYKGSAIEAFIARRLVKVPTVILANLVLGEKVVPEFLQEDAEPGRMAAALAPLLGDTAERTRQVEAFNRLDAIMEIGTARPSDRAAEIVLKAAEG
ncbi:lipid-A-disaccharide synthase [Pseudolabrys sp.]|uniref:lipid-A-disaccharide synthase n=1 Tax=Pseudolabrys sp. TaxID=1960880 RepID=UPI003D144A54